MNNTNNGTRGSKIILFFFELQLNLKMYHWTTMSYANHKATNKLYEKLSDLIDSFVEKYMGAFSRPVLRSGTNIPIQNMNKAKYVRLLRSAQDYLRSDIQKIIEKNSELLNIRDEILSEIDQALYMATLS